MDNSFVLSYGAILAALISGIFVVMNFILSKEQKTSEFRQNWIDGLRKDVAEYISLNEVMFTKLLYYQEMHKYKNDDIQKFLEDHKEDMTKRNVGRNTILLRINPVDDRKIINSINEIEYYWMGKKELNSAQFVAALNILISQMQILLKKEWKRVKRGELTYVVTKYIFVLCIIILTLLIL